jgi:hypothetical protein
MKRSISFGWVAGAGLGLILAFILHAFALRIEWLFKIYFFAASIICRMFFSITHCSEIGCVGCAIVYQIVMVVVFAAVGGVVGWIYGKVKDRIN